MDGDICVDPLLKCMVTLRILLFFFFDVLGPAAGLRRDMDVVERLCGYQKTVLQEAELGYIFAQLEISLEDEKCVNAWTSLTTLRSTLNL